MPGGGGRHSQRERPCCAEVGGDATLGLDGFRHTVQGRPGALWNRNDIEVVAEV